MNLREPDDGLSEQVSRCVFSQLQDVAAALSCTNREFFFPLK